MIKVISGLAGSGKTSYALNNKKDDEILLDIDHLKACFSFYDNPYLLKKIQLFLLDYFQSLNYNIYYITCFPSDEEISHFKSDSEFIWINTDFNQSIKNIIKRDRIFDKKDILKLQKFNKKIESLYLKSDIKFKIINIFKSTEKW